MRFEHGSAHLALPDLATQQAIVIQLDGQLADQREALQAIQALPATVLRGIVGKNLDKYA